MKNRKILYPIGGIVLLILAVSVVIKSSQPNNWAALTVAAQDLKAEIKRKHRDLRYSEPLMKSAPISLMGDGSVRRSWVHYVDTDGYDAPGLTPQAKTAIQNKIANEQATHRKAVICDATVIVLGQVEESTGYITSKEARHEIQKHIYHVGDLRPHLFCALCIYLKIHTRSKLSHTSRRYSQRALSGQYFHLLPGWHSGCAEIFDAIGIQRME